MSILPKKTTNVSAKRPASLRVAVKQADWFVEDFDRMSYTLCNLLLPFSLFDLQRGSTLFVNEA